MQQYKLLSTITQLNPLLFFRFSFLLNYTTRPRHYVSSEILFLICQIFVPKYLTPPLIKCFIHITLLPFYHMCSRNLPNEEFLEYIHLHTINFHHIAVFSPVIADYSSFSGFSIKICQKCSYISYISLHRPFIYPKICCRT